MTLLQVIHFVDLLLLTCYRIFAHCYHFLFFFHWVHAVFFCKTKISSFLACAASRFNCWYSIYLALRNNFLKYWHVTSLMASVISRVNALYVDVFVFPSLKKVITKPQKRYSYSRTCNVTVSQETLQLTLSFYLFVAAVCDTTVFHKM